LHLFEYTDYRAFLKDRTEAIKADKSYFSYRYLATKLEINAGRVAKILNALAGVEAEYFDELLLFCRAKNEKEWDRHFACMQSIRGERFKTVADSQIEYDSAWQHNAMRTLLSIVPFKGTNFRKLGIMMVPQLSADGVYEVPDKFVSTGEKWHAALIASFQREMIRRT